MELYSTWILDVEIRWRRGRETRLDLIELPGGAGPVKPPYRPKSNSTFAKSRLMHTPNTVDSYILWWAKQYPISDAANEAEVYNKSHYLPSVPVAAQSVEHYTSPSTHCLTRAWSCCASG